MVSDKTIRRIINENQNLFIALEELDRTGRLVKTRRKEKVNFTIDEEVMRKLRAYSDEKRINMSRIVEDLIKNLVEKKI